MTSEELRAAQNVYRPADDIAAGLRDKSLVMIVGPAAVGKSSLIAEMTNQAADFGRVSSFTTREPRPNDEVDLYRYLSPAEATALIVSHQVVQYAVHPTTDAIYGTVPADYPKKYNLLDTLSGVVDGLRRLPFRSTVTISLTISPHTWREWFLQRYPESSIERTNRLREARLSIDWSLAQTNNHHWILNETGRLEDVASQAISIARGEARGVDGLQHVAGDLMSIIDELLLIDEAA